MTIFASVRIVTDDVDRLTAFYEHVTGLTASRPGPGVRRGADNHGHPRDLQQPADEAAVRRGGRPPGRQPYDGGCVRLGEDGAGHHGDQSVWVLGTCASRLRAKWTRHR